MSNETLKIVPSVTVWSIVLWLLGVSFVIMGIVGSSISIILAGVILLPTTNALTKKYLNLNISGGARFIIAIVLVVAGIAVSATPEEEIVFEPGEYVVESDEFNPVLPKEVNVYSSFWDPTFLGVLKQGDRVELTTYNAKNKFCEIKSSQINGWVACRWLQKP